MRKSGLIVGLIVYGLIGAKLWADSVNPTSNVLADSANTVKTIVYRDSNGDHTSRDVTVRSIIPTDTTSSRNHLPSTTAISSATMLSVVTVLGDQYATTTADGKLWAVCISTGGTTAANLVLSTTTTPLQPCRQSN